jgi:hypothetical protein
MLCRVKTRGEGSRGPAGGGRGGWGRPKSVSVLVPPLLF